MTADIFHFKVFFIQTPLSGKLLRKAFDVVDHKLLLKKLQVYGLNTNSPKWFQSYLSGRYQKVCVDGKLSELLGIHSGVLQGSILINSHLTWNMVN